MTYEEFVAELERHREELAEGILSYEEYALVQGDTVTEYLRTNSTTG